MATPYEVRLVNGPCDGTAKVLTPGEWDAGETTCKGEVYVFDGVIRPSGQLPHFTFRAGAPPPPVGGVDSTAPHATKAWGSLQAAINRTMPSTLRRVGRVQRATSTQLHRRRRVGR